MKLSLTEHRQAIQEIVNKIGDDGHGIVKPSLFEMVPLEWLAEVSREYKSDGTPKGSIFTDHGIVDSCKGIYTLDALRQLVHDLELPFEGKLGRGWQAREYTSVIKKALEQEELCTQQ